MRSVAAAVLAGGITYTVTNGIKQYTKGRNYEDSSSDATSLAKPILVGIKTEKAPGSVAEEPEPAVEKLRILEDLGDSKGLRMQQKMTKKVLQIEDGLVKNRLK